MSQEWLNSRWFALLVLISTAVSGFLWYFDRVPVIIPLIIGGLPLVLLYLGSHQISISIPYSVLLFLFLLTAATGLWAAYDQEAAAQKFWILLGAVLIFYAVAAQPLANLRPLFWGLCILGLAIAVYFILTYNPIEHPADLAIINKIMAAWAAIRPQTGWAAPESNFTGGILAVLIVCASALWLAAWRVRNISEILLLALMLGIQIATFWLTSSRSAWASLAVGMGVVVWWEISKSVSIRRKISRSQIFRQGLWIAVGLIILLVIIFPAQLFTLANSLPGAASATTRTGLFRNAVDLIPGFWLTGGGLQSFAGLYSQYILEIPYLFFNYSYNLFLDISIEQGVFGLIALLGIFMLASIGLLRGFSRLSKSTSLHRRFYPAVFAALVVLLINGVFDDPFYGERGTPLLFVVPGLAFLLTTTLSQENRSSQPAHRGKRKSHSRKYIPAVIFTGLVATLLVGFHPLASAVEANLGAVQMARIELADFPAESWQDGGQVDQLNPALAHFQQALEYNPGNRTANYRIGLIAMRARDFPTATYYLETAHEIDPTHRGIWKSLGYSYVWEGEFMKAYQFLRILPEAQREMESYATWWRVHERPDLAENAVQMAVLLNEAQVP